MPRVPLLRLRTDRVRVSLDGVIEDEHGDLVLEGQDFGRAVGEVWGGGEYEYWVTVRSAQSDALLVLLVKERFGDDADALVAWLTSQRVEMSGSGGGTIHRVEVRPGGRLVVESARDSFTVEGAAFDGVTLGLLKELFNGERFAHDAAFRQWLTENDVPTDFFSYS